MRPAKAKSTKSGGAIWRKRRNRGVIAISPLFGTGHMSIIIIGKPDVIDKLADKLFVSVVCEGSVVFSIVDGAAYELYNWYNKQHREPYRMLKGEPDYGKEK